MVQCGKGQLPRRDPKEEARCIGALKIDFGLKLFVAK
jgi:hypothetical protein